MAGGGNAVFRGDGAGARVSWCAAAECGRGAVLRVVCAATRTFLSAVRVRARGGARRDVALCGRPRVLRPVCVGRGALRGGPGDRRGVPFSRCEQNSYAAGLADAERRRGGGA